MFGAGKPSLNAVRLLCVASGADLCCFPSFVSLLPSGTDQDSSCCMSDSVTVVTLKQMR